MMKKFLALLFIFLIISQPILKGDTDFITLNKLKGICVRADDLEKAGIEKSLSDIAYFGYNAIFVLAKTPEGYVVFNSKNFPTLVDNLSKIIEIAKSKNLKVYAYFPIIMDKYFLSKNPTEGMGNLGYEKNTYYVSLLSDKYLSYVKLFLKELLAYDVDGIVFDYIRYPNGSYDFLDKFVALGKKQGIDMEFVSNVAYKTFVKPADWKTMFKLYEEKDKNIASWVNLRELVLKQVALNLVNYAKSIKQDLEFGAFLVSRGYRYDTIEEAPSITKTYPYQKVNFAYFGDTFKDIVDFVIPMVYLSSLKETEDYVEYVANKIKSLTNNTLKFYIGINPSSIAIEETQLEIKNAYLNSYGVVLFRYPLFTMGKALPISPIAFNEDISFKVINTKNESRITKVPFSSLILPPAEKEIIVENFYRVFNLKFIIGSFTFFVNNESYQMDVAPFIKDSRTFVPVRFLSEAMGLKVDYKEKTKEVLIEDGLIVLKIGSKDYFVNGEKLTMDVTPFIENSRTYVPLRFIMEAFKFDVLWDSTNKTIEINGISRID